MLAKVTLEVSNPQIFYHKEDYNNSLNYLLLAGDHFQLTTRTQFADKLILEAIDRYCSIRQHNYVNQTSGDVIAMDSNLEKLVDSVFE